MSWLLQSGGAGGQPDYCSFVHDQVFTPAAIKACTAVDVYIHFNNRNWVPAMRELVKGVDLKGTFGCAAFSLRKTARVVTQLYDQALREAGLRSTQFTVLVSIAKSQPASVGDLATKTLMDATTMTRHLSLLKAEGLVDVAPRGRRRAKLVRLTAKGEKALVRATPVWRDMQARFVGAFGERRWNEMRRELELLAGLAARPQ